MASAPSAGSDAEAAGASTPRLRASPDECHGRCFGAEAERGTWPAPGLAVGCEAAARPGYDTMGASEYEDTVDVLTAKVRLLASYLGRARRCVVYSGAGLSTSAGIGDYASQAPQSLAGCMAGTTSFRSPFCAQPTAAHRALVALHRAGRVHRWVNQNHDGLPQKAGLPQEAINEIHGAWHAPDNPVIPMSGSLRDDLFEDLLTCAREADLVLAVGTSLCGMNADRVVLDPARRAASGAPGQLGAVIVGLQQTVHDAESTLRIFARCDDVFTLLAAEMQLDVSPAWPSGSYFTPSVLEGRGEDDYLFEGLPYNAAGELANEGGETITLDVRDGAELVIPRGMHAGAVGEVDGFDREGNIKCRFTLKPKSGKLRAPVPMLLGRWWLQAAVDGKALALPVVNAPADISDSHAAERLRELMHVYAQ